MTQVVIPTNLGGTGITYSDDGTGVRDLRNGGHRPWLLPMMSETTAACFAAVSAAQQATSLAGTAITGSSSTSLTISTGTKVLTIETGKAFVPGMSVRIGDATAPNTNFMDGTVTTYNAGTGTLTVNVTAIGGSGTLNSWSVRPPTANVNGDAGPTITTSTSLTSASARVRPVAMATDFQSVTLPDATTLPKGGPLFVLPNTGNRPFGVRDSAGTLLRAVLPSGVAELYLRDNATSAGSWTVSGQGLSPVMTIWDNTLPSTLTQGSIVAARLSDTLAVHFGRNVSDHPFVFAADSTPGSAAVGSPALIVASALDIEHAFRISATKAMVKIAGTTNNVFNVTVDPVTRACTVGGTPASAAVFDAATFTGAPLIAQLGANNDLFVAVDTTGGNTVRAQAVDCSGANPSAGSSVNISALGSADVGVCGIYRVTDTTALVIYTDNSGTAGSPFSIRAVVLSLSGTSITVNTPQGLNDVTAQGAVALANCQLSATSYLVGFLDATNSDRSAVHIGVSGVNVTFGTKFAVEVGTFTDNNTYLDGNSNRFQPLLYPLSSTTALYTFGETGSSARHVVITNNAGSLSAGTPLFGAFTFGSGGNFPQASDGFLVIDGATAQNQVYSVTVNGTALNVTGTFGRSDVRLTGNALGANARFGLSGGIRGVFAEYTSGGPACLLHLFRFAAGGPPVYLGAANLNGTTVGGFMVELAPSKAGIVQAVQPKDTTTNRVKLTILEFAAA